MSADKAPRLSLGLPVYNGERFLAACLDSILGQTWGDFEVIACDNASTDGTAAMLAEYAARDGRIRIHRAEVNRGAAANFNWTFELARGELFKWCAADDVLRSTFLAECIAALDSQPDAVLAWSGALDIDDDGRVLREIYDNRDPMRFDAATPAARFHELVCWDHSCIAVFGVVRTPAMRRTSLIGPYVGSDRTFLAELGLQGRLVRIGDDLLLHREHAGRSVNEIADLRRRTVWFDSKARGPAFPHWRLMREYMHAVNASGLPPAERQRCLMAVARWIKWRAWRQLLGDVSYNIRSKS
jgi:glycosyltransferase involved in cell wall biosynthesis